MVIRLGCRLSPEAESELKRLGVKTVYIMGGEASISKETFDQIQALGINAIRVAGESRQATSITAMQYMEGQSNTVAVSSGERFADALSIAPASYAKRYPIVLTQKDGTLSADQVEAIKAAGFGKFIVVGGAAVVKPSVETQLEEAGLESSGRLAGDDRYATSSVIAQWAMNAGMSADSMGVASGQKFPDALSGAAFCGKRGSVIVLADDTNISNVSFVKSNAASIVDGYVFGGSSAVGDKTWNALVGEQQLSTTAFQRFAIQ